MKFPSLISRLILACIASRHVVLALPNVVDAPGQKLVVAHYIVGNTYPYQEQDWKRAITLAASKGIDAFALDMGGDGWQPARVADAYKAAIGTTFKLFMMFDMASLPCATVDDGKLLRDMITAYDQHSNQLKYQGKSLVSTFGGQFCMFGTKHMDEGWTNVLKTNLPPVHFVPSYFIEPPIFPSLKAINGAFSWDSAWPMGNYDITSAYDDEYLMYLTGRSYMAGVSPWFFTHYARENLNKNMIYRGDNWLFVERWELLIKYRSKIDLVQVISWNDYGESHYMGPIDGAQYKSEGWTTGFDHQGWLDLLQYYAQAFKTGSYPKITKDRVWMWGRLYPAQADAPDTIGKPLNFNWTEDYIWGIVFLSGDAHLEMACGESRLSVNLKAGANKVKLPLTNDCSPNVQVVRGAQKTVDFTPVGYNFRKNPPTYNFNAFVAASPA